MFTAYAKKKECTVNTDSHYLCGQYLQMTNTTIYRNIEHGQQ